MSLGGNMLKVKGGAWAQKFAKLESEAKMKEL